MAKHRLNRRKPNVEPRITHKEEPRPKQPKRHKKSYYKPKTPKPKKPKTKPLTATVSTTTTELHKQFKREQREWNKKQKLLKKRYNQLRRKEKKLQRKHTQVRYPKQYTIEYDVSRETPTENTYTTYDRDDHFRTVETPEIDDINYSLDDYINLIQSVHDEVKSKWDERGEFFRACDIAGDLLNAIFWLEEAKSLPYESKEAIVNQLASSQDLDRVTDIVMLEDYHLVIESCMDIANTIMSVVESVRG